MRLTRWPAALLWGLAFALPVFAQEEPAPKEPPPPPPAETKPAPAEAAPAKKSIEEPPIHRWGAFTVSVAVLDPSMVGADGEVAGVVQNVGSTPLLQTGSSRIQESVRVTYHIPHDGGAIVGQYDAVSQDDTLQNFQPGQFVFLESRAFPQVRGVFDDGLSDGVSSSALRKSREFRLEYSREAFNTRWARAQWGAGYHQLSHDRALGITYYALVAGLPPLIPPIVQEGGDPHRLDPIPDFVSQSSGFSGHGLGASFDVQFPVHPRVAITTGLSIGLINGTADSSYTSTNAYYFLDSDPTTPLTKDQLFYYMNISPFPTDPPHVSVLNVDQGQAVAGSRSGGTSQFAQTYDVYVGLEVTAYKGLKVFGQLRDVSYINAGEYAVIQSDGSTLTKSLNVGYEGYLLGLSWRW